MDLPRTPAEDRRANTVHDRSLHSGRHGVGRAEPGGAGETMMRGHDTHDPALEQAAAIIAASRTADAVQRALDVSHAAARTSTTLTRVKRVWRDVRVMDLVVAVTAATAVHVAAAWMLPPVVRPT